MRPRHSTNQSTLSECWRSETRSNADTGIAHTDDQRAPSVPEKLLQARTLSEINNSTDTVIYITNRTLKRDLAFFLNYSNPAFQIACIRNLTMQ